MAGEAATMSMISRPMPTYQELSEMEVPELSRYDTRSTHDHKQDDESELYELKSRRYPIKKPGSPSTGTSGSVSSKW